MEKTKKCLMTQYPCARGRAFVCKNIGDYVQSVASRQYVEPLDGYIEQEEADKYFPDDGIKARLIMNGWFQWRAENWPPSEYIIPLLVSMHISPLRKDQLLTEQGIAFLKKNGPVGCRDLYTKQLLESVGVPAYFSACVTLTLGKNYFTPLDQRDGIYFVDPYFDIPEIKIKKDDGSVKKNYWLSLKTFLYYCLHANAINKLATKKFFREYSPIGFLDRNTDKNRAKFKATIFYKTYIKKFSKHLLLDAHYITHWLDVDMKKDTNEDLLNYAESLVKQYSKAKMVVTSRIHAGLPCLGMSTPVVFIANEEVTSMSGNFNTPGRLDGLLELFRVINLSKKGVFSTGDSVFAKIKKFGLKTHFANKEDYKVYSDKLDKQLTEFMKD